MAIAAYWTRVREDAGSFVSKGRAAKLLVLLGLISPLASSAAFGQSANVQGTAKTACLGPVVKERVPLNCEQAWAWHIMLNLVLHDFQARSDIFDAAERHALDGHEMFDAAITVGESFSNILPRDAIANARTKFGERFVNRALEELSENAIKEGPWFALNLFETRDSSPLHDQVANSVLNTVRSMYDAVITGASEPWNAEWDALELWNDSVSLFQYVGLVRSRQTLNLVRDFLWKYFEQGGNIEAIIKPLGLPVNTSIDRIVNAMANQRRWNWFDYSASSAAELIQSYIKVIRIWAGWCVRIGVKTGMCSAPAMRSYEDMTSSEASDTSFPGRASQGMISPEPKVPAPLTTRELIFHEFRTPNGASTVVRNGKAISIDLIGKNGERARYEAAAVHSESEVWDLVFVDQYYVRPPSGRFVLRYKNYGRLIVLGRYFSICPASEDLVPRAICVRDELARRNHVSIK